MWLTMYINMTIRLYCLETICYVNTISNIGKTQNDWVFLYDCLITHMKQIVTKSFVVHYKLPICHICKQFCHFSGQSHCVKFQCQIGPGRYTKNMYSNLCRIQPDITNKIVLSEKSKYVTYRVAFNSLSVTFLFCNQRV
jgi:hypothetical protein